MIRPFLFASVAWFALSTPALAGGGGGPAGGGLNVPAPIANGTVAYPIFPNTANTASIAAPAQNAARCTAFNWPWASHVDKASMTVSTLGTGPLNFALYTDAVDSVTGRHQPQTLITDPSLTFTVTAAATVTVNLGTAGVGVPLAKGLNWACINDAATGDAVRYYSLLTTSTAVVALVGATSPALSSANTALMALQATSITAGTWPSFAGVAFNEAGGLSTPNFALELASAP